MTSRKTLALAPAPVCLAEHVLPTTMQVSSQDLFTTVVRYSVGSSLATFSSCKTTTRRLSLLEYGVRAD